MNKVDFVQANKEYPTKIGQYFVDNESSTIWLLTSVGNTRVSLVCLSDGYHVRPTDIQDFDCITEDEWMDITNSEPRRYTHIYGKIVIQAMKSED